MTKTKLKSGDLVKVITGKYRGTIDYISHLDLKETISLFKERLIRKNMISLLPKIKKRVN